MGTYWTVDEFGNLVTTGGIVSTSTTHGFLLPSLTTTQRDAIVSPATGLQIFNTTDNQIEYYTGSVWTAVSSGGGGSPGGSNTDIQFNNSGAFGGSSNLTWDGTNLKVGADALIDSANGSVSFDAGAITSDGFGDFTATGDVTLGSAGGALSVASSAAFYVDSSGNVQIGGNSSLFNPYIRLYDLSVNYVQIQAPTSVSSSYNLRLPTAQGASATFLSNDGSGNLSWASAGSGSVTSVAFADDSTTPIYSVSGSPVTTSGTLAITLSNQSVNTVFAGPSIGTATQPTFRALVAADIPNLASIYVTQTEVGVASGVASLDASGKVPVSQLPSTVLEYQGAWNPTTNTPTLSDSTGTNGYVYWVSAAYSGTIAGLTDPSMTNFEIGDLVIYSSAVGKWQLSTPAAGVQSVNGAQGVVTVNAINQLTGDVTTSAASQSQSLAATLATVNSNVGTFSYPTFTVNAKGLVTAASSNTPVTSITGTTNQVIASASTGAVTLSLPQNVATTSSPSFASLALTNTSGVVLSIAGTAGSTAVSIIGDLSANNIIANGNISIENNGSLNLTPGSGGAISVQAPSTTTSGYTLRLPSAVASSTGQALTSDTGGNLSWTTIVGTTYSAGTGLTLTGTTFSLTTPVTIALGGTNSTTALSNNLVMISSGGSIVESTISTTLLGYLSGVTSNIQTQLNSKQATLTEGNLTESTSSVLTISGGTNAVIGSGTTIQVLQASGTQSGYLSAADWTTFNNKQSSGNYITALTGDATATGPGSVTLTLATVNSNVGTFTYPSVTVNAKGLITSITSGTAPTTYSAGTGLTLTGTTFSLTAPVTIALGGTNSTTSLNNNRVMVSSGGAIVEASAITANSALVSNSNGIPVASTTTATELGYVHGVTSNIQTQLNALQPSGNYITALTGDVTASGPGSSTATLATVNSNVGTFSYPSVTVNGKGLVTAISSQTPVTSLTGTTNQVNVSASTGAVTLSLPQSIATTSSPTFTDLTLTDTSATTLNINNGGGITITTANTAGSITGSGITVTTGNTTASGNIVGGTVTLTSGNTNNGNTTGASLLLTSGNAPTSEGNIGGSITLTTSNTSTAGYLDGGSITLTTGTATTNINLNGGGITLTTGNDTSNFAECIGGNLILTSGNGGSVSQGGSITLTSGTTSNGSPAGGNITLTCSTASLGGSLILTGTGSNGTTGSPGHGNIYANYLTLTSLTNTDGVVYQTSGGTLASTTSGTSGQVLTSNGSGSAPTFQNATGTVAYREDYVVGTALNNYTGSLTVFNLVNAYSVGSHTLLVTLDGDVQTVGSTVDYVETNSTTVTFNNSLVTGQKVSFIFQTTSSGASGTVNTGTTNHFAYYPSNTNTVSSQTQVTYGVNGLTVTDIDPSLDLAGSGTEADVLMSGSGFSYDIQAESATFSMIDVTNSRTFFKYTTSTGAISLTGPLVSTASNSADQIDIAPSGAGNFGILNYATDNIQMYFDALWNGSNVIAKATDAFRIAKSSGQLIIAGNTGLTSGSSWSTITPLLVIQPAAIGGVQLTGTAAGDNAATGIVGEAIRSQVSGVTAGTSGQGKNITSISLTAGDWDVSGIGYYYAPSATVTGPNNLAISLYANNAQTDWVGGDNVSYAIGSGASLGYSIGFGAVPVWRVSVSSTTTVYLIGLLNYSGTAPTMAGRISARRVR